MLSEFIKLLSVLLLSFQLLSEEFTFFNSYDAETNEGVVGLRLFGKNDKFIGLNCSPGDNFDGPLLWFSLGQSVKSSSLGAPNEEDLTLCPKLNHRSGPSKLSPGEQLRPINLSFLPNSLSPTTPSFVSAS